MRIVHVTWATTGRQPAFPTTEALNAALHAIARIAGAKLVLFALVDDHVHLVLLLLDGELRRLRTSLTRVLNEAAAAPFSAPHVVEVTTRGHMERLLRYCLTQNPHHGLAEHPALAPGSCFPDLVGARQLPGLRLPINTALPRYRPQEAYAAVGLSGPLVPATLVELCEIGPFGIARATAAALAVAPHFAGNTPLVAAARRAAVVLAAEAGLRPASMAAPLGITSTAAARLACRPVSGGVLSAIRLRVSLEGAVQAGGPPGAAGAAHGKRGG